MTLGKYYHVKYGNRSVYFMNHCYQLSGVVIFFSVISFFFDCIYSICFWRDLQNLFLLFKYFLKDFVHLIITVKEAIVSTLLFFSSIFINKSLFIRTLRLRLTKNLRTC